MYLKEELNHRVWVAFSRLIEKRYQRSLGFSPAINALDLSKEFVITRQGDLLVPLFTPQQFLGGVLVKQGGTLEPQVINEIHSMIQKVGSALLDMTFTVDQAVDQMDTLGSFPEDSKKHLISLVGGSFDLRQKIACRIQDTIGSWSMLPWADAGMAQWNTDDMSSLTDICLYVRDIFELAPIERQQLITLSQLPSSMRPHLIIGSSLSLSEYLKDESVEAEIVKFFSPSTFLVEQLPQDSLRLKEVLEMLLVGSKPIRFEGQNLL